MEERIMLVACVESSLTVQYLAIVEEKKQLELGSKHGHGEELKQIRGLLLMILMVMAHMKVKYTRIELE